MRLSVNNIYKTYKERRKQQELEVKENSSGPHKVWDMDKHKGWGNNISWLDWDKRSLYGHTTPLPKVGDEILSPMLSGKKGSFIIAQIRYCTDPSDMWFATVKDNGYAPTRVT